MNKRNYKEQGFTLIELLIVIVIIGILSGVLIAVINPVRQQNRSRNATIKASLNKAAFGISTARAGLGRLPSNSDLTEELENITLVDGACIESTTALECQFNVSGTVLPRTCANGYSTDGDTQCNMYVISPEPEGAEFRVIAKAYKLNPGDDDEDSLVYVFDAGTGFYQCLSTVDVADFTVDVSTDEGCTPESGN